ncbi:hypothetical protein HY30_07780 [Hyphomonas chukchiensis]|uniref:Uncharacterized protein n=1 Tax=Hyphomonas chukchiensis TaxID=1280947 RepID=A0A062UHU8_9PROT|nr:hypothetical protein HY30_07780 [Hyphomonas chukchiensis]
MPGEIGIVSLERRWEPRLDKDIHEIKRGDEHIMGVLFQWSKLRRAGRTRWRRVRKIDKYRLV